MPGTRSRPSLRSAPGGRRPPRGPSLLGCGPARRGKKERLTNEMTPVPTAIALPPEPRHGRDDPLPRNAKIYYGLVAVIAAAVTLPFVGNLQDAHGWTAFVILASAAAIARLFVVRTPGNQAYHTDIVFLIPAALILPPELLVLVAIIQMVPEWLKMRYRWHLQTFNILDYLLASMAAWFVGREVILAHTWIGNS